MQKMKIQENNSCTGCLDYTFQLKQLAQEKAEIQLKYKQSEIDRQEILNKFEEFGSQMYETHEFKL